MMKCGEEHCKKDCPLRNVKSITVSNKRRPVEKCNKAATQKPNTYVSLSQ